MAGTEERLEAAARPDDVIAAILEDHADIKELFGQLEHTSDTQSKAEVFECLVRKLVVHETAEQEIVHPVTKQNEAAESVVEARLEEERKAEAVLDRLEEMDLADPTFDATFRTLRADVERHAEREEKEELPRLEGAQPEERLVKMAKAFRGAQKLAPTHPHPHGPQSAGGKMVTGPIVAIADRTRDAIRDVLNR